MTHAVVLCGGRSTRLPGPPKTLRVVADRPFIFHKLDSLQEQGIDTVTLLVGPYESQFDNIVFGTDYPCSMPRQRIDIIGDTGQGTGSALVEARLRLPGAFWLTYGDSLLGCAVGAPEAALELYSNVALFLVCDRNDFLPQPNIATFSSHLPSGVIQFSPELDPQYPPERSFVDYGMIALRRRVVDTVIEPGPMDLHELLEGAVRGNLVRAAHTKASLHHINTPHDLSRTEQHLEDLRGRPEQ